jgi:hypothetical protein
MKSVCRIHGQGKAKDVGLRGLATGPAAERVDRTVALLQALISLGLWPALAHGPPEAAAASPHVALVSVGACARAAGRSDDPELCVTAPPSAPKTSAPSRLPLPPSASAPRLPPLGEDAA